MRTPYCVCCLVALLLAGCAHPEPVYVRAAAPASTDAALKGDLWECKRQAMEFAPVVANRTVATPVRSRAVRAAERECMEARGWRADDAS